MFQAFIIILREGFEAFLIVAIILAYLHKTRKSFLVPAVYWGIGTSIFVSAGMGYLLYQGFNGPFWEGFFGLISAVFVTAFVLHMWKTAPYLKCDMENGLQQAVSEKTAASAWLGVFAFTVIMISREGMETALLMLQVQDPQMWTGILLGVAASAGMALLWVRFNSLINLKIFFQVTALFLLLFVIQILIYSFHEFTEAGILPNSEYLHSITEAYSPEGYYGKWFPLVMVGVCAVWMIAAGFRHKKQTAAGAP